MGQISAKISPNTGSDLSGNQHSTLEFEREADAHKNAQIYENGTDRKDGDHGH
jgi:hypothetical protein